MSNEARRAALKLWLEDFNNEIVKDKDFVARCISGGGASIIQAGNIIAYHAAALFNHGKTPAEAAKEVIATARESWDEAERQILMNMPIQGIH
jgi:hypothetical protein